MKCPEIPNGCESDPSAGLNLASVTFAAHSCACQYWLLYLSRLCVDPGMAALARCMCCGLARARYRDRALRGVPARAIRGRGKPPLRSAPDNDNPVAVGRSRRAHANRSPAVGHERARCQQDRSNHSQLYLIRFGVQDGLSWLLASPEESLPFVLADHGFDVWIANTRGTRWSRRHVSLDPSSRVRTLRKLSLSC